MLLVIEILLHLKNMYTYIYIYIYIYIIYIYIYHISYMYIYMHMCAILVTRNPISTMHSMILCTPGMSVDLFCTRR